MKLPYPIPSPVRSNIYRLQECFECIFSLLIRKYDEWLMPRNITQIKYWYFILIPSYLHKLGVLAQLPLFLQPHHYFSLLSNHFYHPTIFKINQPDKNQKQNWCKTYQNNKRSVLLYLLQKLHLQNLE